MNPLHRPFVGLPGGCRDRVDNDDDGLADCDDSDCHTGFWCTGSGGATGLGGTLYGIGGLPPSGGAPS